MHKILVIRIYFPLDALHISDYNSPLSGATFVSCTSHLVYADMSVSGVAIATDDGIIQSETCTASNRK